MYHLLNVHSNMQEKRPTDACYSHFKNFAHNCKKITLKRQNIIIYKCKYFSSTYKIEFPEKINNKMNKNLGSCKMVSKTVIWSVSTITFLIQNRTLVAMVYHYNILQQTSRGVLVCKGVNQIQVDWTLQAVIQIPLEEKLYLL